MDAPKNLKELEAALPSLIVKLKELQQTLSPEEKMVLSEIIESAALHTDVVEAHEEGSPELAYTKPKSVHSTVAMKKEYKKLPETLGLKQEE